jgi:ABC-2 type transport system ATP-binding protein
MTSAIETFDLTRRFGRSEAVNRLSLRVPAGSVFALIGPNGAGKTTTIKVLMNLLRPSRGRAIVLGTDSRHLGPREFARIGYISENQHLPDWMTTDQLLDYVRPFYPTWDAALCQKLRSDLGLTASTPLRSMSRGTKMKASLLSSIASRPELLVLDEPFTGLDPLVRDELIRALLELPGDHPWTVFISSHDIDEVERLADWIAFIDRGGLVFAEPVSALLNRFRLIEIVAPNGSTPSLPVVPGWWLQGVAGRTLRFIDSAFDASDASARLAAAFPGAEIRDQPISLREIFVGLVRRSESSQAKRREAS